MFSFCKKGGFEFSHSPEHAFTSGAIYCLEAEIFWASPHFIEGQVGMGEPKIFLMAGPPHNKSHDGIGMQDPFSLSMMFFRIFSEVLQFFSI